MAAAAKREQQKQRGDDDDDEGRRSRSAEPFLNETSFDRRKVVAVYKPDGDRGHHMQV